MFLNHLCGSTLDSLQGFHACLVMRTPELGPELRPELQVFISRAEQRAVTISGFLMFHLIQSWMLLIFFDTRAHRWLMVNFSTRITRSHLSSCFLVSWPIASTACSYSSLYVGLGISICWTSWSSFWPTPSAWWDPFEQQHNCSFHCLKSCWGCTPPSRLFMRIINKSRPSIKSCGTLLVTGLHLVFEMLLTTSTVSQFGSFAIHLPICLYNPHFLRFSEKMVMKGNIKSFAKFRIKLFHFSPFINQSPHCKRLSRWVKDNFTFIYPCLLLLCPFLVSRIIFSITFLKINVRLAGH